MICCGDANLQEKMAASIEPPYRIKPKGMHYYAIEKTLFEIDMNYEVCSNQTHRKRRIWCGMFIINKDTNEKVAIKKVSNIIVVIQ